MSNVIDIDQVKQTQDPLESNLKGDKLPIEWYESQKILFQRHTLLGRAIKVEKPFQGHWQSGDLLYANGHFIAEIQIKPCLCICLKDYHLAELIDFSYYIGNRHLPLFVNEQSTELLVAYDGNLLEQLKNKFQHKITLVNQVLHPCLLLKKQFI